MKKIIENAGNKIALNDFKMNDYENEWVLTNQYPFYFIREEKTEDEEITYTAISLFFVDHSVMVEIHTIGKEEVDEFEVEDEIIIANLGEQFYQFNKVELALTDGLGEVSDSKTFKQCEYRELNSFLEENNLPIFTVEEDFNY